ncbi:MAG: hypothetical protein MRQ09_05775 [Candidatus Midichloria sp.]|nr:hypothetical protein [Candidatus Midichloria sp.]
MATAKMILLIGARYASPDGKSSAGQAYVVFGSSFVSSPFELSSLNGTNGFIINGSVFKMRREGMWHRQEI